MKKIQMNTKEIEMRVIYIRFRGTYAAFRKASSKMVKALFAFAEKNDLIDEKVTKVLTMYHDNPFITDETNLKTSVAMTVPKDVQLSLEGEISEMTFSGKYAELQYELSPREYDLAWQDAYEWLLKGEEEKSRDEFPFELYVTEPPRSYKGTSITSIFLPIE